MKTGRVRKKAGATTKQPSMTEPAVPAAATLRPASRPATSTTGRLSEGHVAKPANGRVVAALLLSTFGCFAVVMILFTALGGRKADDWIPVTRVDGEWTTTVKIWGPQATRDERWEADCRANPQATVRPGTCMLKDTQQYHDRVVDDYEEYAYKIYHEETHDQVYEARGTEFVITSLGADDWWEQNLHYVLEEELDSGSCEHTGYTTWVDDPGDTTHEIEVYLAECEVWDHVSVYERVYEQGNWCGCDVIAVVEVGQEIEQGTGAAVRWPNPLVPAGGRTERAFKGSVTFQSDDYTYTTTTDELAVYQDCVTNQFYIGLDDGKPIRVSKNPK